MLPYAWAVGLGKIQGLPAGGRWGSGVRTFWVWGNLERRHETCQNQPSSKLILECKYFGGRSLYKFRENERENFEVLEKR